MVYKSKKINKRRNFKRQSRRKMSGGEAELPVNTTESDKSANEIMKQIEDQNKIGFPSFPTLPDKGSVLQDTGNLVESAATKALDKMGDLYRCRY